MNLYLQKKIALLMIPFLMVTSASFCQEIVEKGQSLTKPLLFLDTTPKIPDLDIREDPATPLTPLTESSRHNKILKSFDLIHDLGSWQVINLKQSLENSFSSYDSFSTTSPYPFKMIQSQIETLQSIDSAIKTLKGTSQQQRQDILKITPAQNRELNSRLFLLKDIFNENSFIKYKTRLNNIQASQKLTPQTPPRSPKSSYNWIMQFPISELLALNQEIMNSFIYYKRPDLLPSSALKNISNCIKTLNLVQNTVKAVRLIPEEIREKMLGITAEQNYRLQIQMTYLENSFKVIPLEQYKKRLAFRVGRTDRFQ